MSHIRQIEIINGKRTDQATKGKNEERGEGGIEFNTNQGTLKEVDYEAINYRENEQHVVEWESKGNGHVKKKNGIINELKMMIREWIP